MVGAGPPKEDFVLSIVEGLKELEFILIRAEGIFLIGVCLASSITTIDLKQRWGILILIINRIGY